MSEPEIQYTECHYGDCEDCRTDIESFVDDNLGKHLEERVKKLQALIAPLVKAAVLNGSMSVEQLAYILDANGRDFKLVEPE